jgi:hypothetical protein
MGLNDSPKVLTPADKKKIDAALHAVLEALPEIERAEQAGEDVEELKMRALHQRDRLMQIKRSYFPSEP